MKNTKVYIVTQTIVMFSRITNGFGKAQVSIHGVFGDEDVAIIEREKIIRELTYQSEQGRSLIDSFEVTISEYPILFDSPTI